MTKTGKLYGDSLYELALEKNVCLLYTSDAADDS